MKIGFILAAAILAGTSQYALASEDGTNAAAQANNRDLDEEIRKRRLRV